MDLRIRPIKPDEFVLLEDFLYEAIFVPEGAVPPDRGILLEPELQVYIEHFGKRPDDHCLVAETGSRVIGAVWTRIMDDYGHVDDETPSFAISLFKEYRGRGIGTELMKAMLDLLSLQGYRRASLSVQKDNPALFLYERLGDRKSVV